MIVQRPVDLAIDMNDYRCNRWGEYESIEAALARKMASDRGVPYYCMDAGWHPECDAAVSYPRARIFWRFCTDYFGSTTDYAIALAIDSGAEEINLWGLNVLHWSEYAKQKPSMEFWLGVAKGAGIVVHVHGDRSELLYTQDRRVYGYDIQQELAYR